MAVLYKNTNSLTGLRFVLAIEIFLVHMISIFPAIHFPFIEKIESYLVQSLYFFFMLSGFFLHQRYHQKLTTKKFFLARFAKVFPNYFLLTTICFILFRWLMPADLSAQWKTYFLNISFLRTFNDKYLFTLIGPGYTLTSDVILYALTPLIFIYLRVKKNFYLKAISLVVIFNVTGYAVYKFCELNGLPFFNTDVNFAHSFIDFSASFLLGIIISYAFNDNAKIFEIKHKTYAGILSSIFLSYIVFQADYNIYLKIFSIKFILLLPTAIILMGLISEQTLFSKLLSTKFFEVLGNASYAFYLLHFSIIMIVPANLKFIQSPILYFLITLIISITWFYAVEKPLHTLIQGKKLSNYWKFKTGFIRKTGKEMVAPEKIAG